MNIRPPGATLDPGEIWVLDYVRDELPSGSTKLVFDVGANTGAYSLEVLRCLGSDTHVYCFEPSCETYQLLCDALGNYGNVECLNFALGQTEELRTLYYYEGQSGLASLYDRFALSGSASGNGYAKKREEQIHVKTIDWFCDSRGIDHIALLKLDVEGHELKVLQGAQRLIQEGAVDFIQFEFGCTQIDSRTFMHDFHELLHENFEIYRILKDGLSPVKSFKGAHEIFEYSNFLAVSRKVRTLAR